MRPWCSFPRSVSPRSPAPSATTPALAFDYLRCLSAVDYVDYMEVVYHLFSLRHRQKAVLKTRLVEPHLEVDSVVAVWRGADWHEREAADLFGIVFRHHPHLKRLLLPDEFEGFPLRKSYPLAPLPTEAGGGGGRMIEPGLQILTAARGEQLDLTVNMGASAPQHPWGLPDVASGGW
ncbi:MAG: hypothetical protein KatS3mg061_2726 [Dehalococcoidia bacterium]|nr:MAG: hypothetical protein KatS3mg061_2726 [Dehalococcoidia bacterium]